MGNHFFHRKFKTKEFRRFSFGNEGLPIELIAYPPLLFSLDIKLSGSIPACLRMVLNVPSGRSPW
jgi:hypothetical protein